MIVMMMMMMMGGGREKSILELACSLICSVQLIKQGLDKMKESDHNEKNHGTVVTALLNNTTRAMITL